MRSFLLKIIFLSVNLNLIHIVLLLLIETISRLYIVFHQDDVVLNYVTTTVNVRIMFAAASQDSLELGVKVS